MLNHYTPRDKDIFSLINKELLRQQNSIELIASENIVSKDVLEATGSILTNKYAEGYPHHRYYGGCEFVDAVEDIARERLKKLFNCKYANVQPHSGSQANQAVMMTIANPGDTYLALNLSHGGHLTHGAKVSQSGKWFNAIHYELNQETMLIDYDQVRSLAKQYMPKFIIAGGSAYPREIDFKIFRSIADEVNAYLWVDMAHFAGLVAAKEHSNPLDFADVVTSTTHKTLRGPRGGVILSNNEELGKLIDKSVFPGLQGGPLMHVIAAKAVAFHEALQPSFKDYIIQVKKNAQILASEIQKRGYNLVTGGTDTHLILVDLRSKNIKGNIAEKTLQSLGITCNKNSIPFDTEKPTITSGIRLGSPASTSRGFNEKDFTLVANLIADVLDNINNIDLVRKRVSQQVLELCKNYPIYQELEK